LKPRLYLETTIPSYLVARRSSDLRLAADQESTEEWWEKRRHDFDLFVSEIVINEVSRGDSRFAAARLAAIREIQALRDAPDAAALTKQLLAGGIIPPRAAGDAAHLGLAAAYKMDYLLTWNCRHINNPALRRRIEQACAECGLMCPVICTPAELMKVEL
jgi:predicted nucleic acid-binding protein